MVISITVMRPPVFIQAMLLLMPLIRLYPSYVQEAKPLIDPMVIQFIHLDYADAEHLAPVLSPLLSMEDRVVTYRPANSLIIEDSASLVRRLVGIVKQNSDPQVTRKIRDYHMLQ